MIVVASCMCRIYARKILNLPFSHATPLFSSPYLILMKQIEDKNSQTHIEKTSSKLAESNQHNYTSINLRIKGTRQH